MFNGNKIYKVDKSGNKRRILGFIPGLNIRFKGKNSTVTLHEPMPKFSKCRIKLENNSNFVIKSSHDMVKKLNIQMASDQTCEIGKEFFTFGCEIVFSTENNLTVKIGDNCVFARNILIRPSDGHSIFDKDSKELKNPGKSIEIGNHVWIAGNSAILKGVHILDNCVIGHGSVVTKNTTEPNSVYAGNPAKCVKSNINWSNVAPDKYLEIME